jgi:RNA-directed DNA polymerase
MEGKDDMTKPSTNLQDLRRKIYTKAKADKAWRFWGLYVHVCKPETLHTAYKMAKKNKGSPGIDGVTFDAIEESGVDKFLEEIHHELVTRTYLPLRNRIKEIPKSNGKFRSLGIPSIRDRVVQGALNLILEPIFEAGFQDGSYGYRPKRTAHQATDRISTAIVCGKTSVIDIDLSSYFDTIRHDILLSKIARRVNDKDIMCLLKLMLKTGGKRGVPQGSVISPLLSNIYLNDIDTMLEKAKEVTRNGRFTGLEYARFADDLVILVDHRPQWDWLLKAIRKRLYEEFEKLSVSINTEKTKMVNLIQGEKFDFLGFSFRRYKTRKGKWGVFQSPKGEKRTALTSKLRDIFYRHRSQPIERVVKLINPILRGWTNYFRVGNSARCFGYVSRWVEKKIRRHLMRARGKSGFGWKKWSSSFLYRNLGLYSDYQIRYYMPAKASPTQ